MADPIVAKPAWQLANGEPKPEHKFALRTPLSDGSKSLTLSEPTVKALRKATKLLVMGANGEPTPDSGLDFAVELLAHTAGLDQAIIEELPQSVFKDAQEYLQSFR